VAQKALLNLDHTLRARISHLLLFGTPSNGLKSSFLEKLWNRKYRELDVSGDFIKQLRQAWDAEFTAPYPFIFKTIAGTHDEFVPTDSSLRPFDKIHYLTVPGSHFSMIKPESTQNDTYLLMLNLLTQADFVQQHADKEEEEILMGEYDAVINKLLPRENELDKTGLEQLIFALEGADRAAEAVEILEKHVLAQEDSDWLGVLGGRYKRKYLKEYLKSDGENAIKYYAQALAIARKKKDCKQIYYHAINLAFLSLIISNDTHGMQKHAKMALEACDDDPFDSLWRLATLAEANLYLGKLEVAKEYYENAAHMAGPRERISIHTNAYTAACRLLATNSPDHPFIKFLSTNFLS
jgi:tetratricopeptide (TPR) repeat protein